MGPALFRVNAVLDATTITYEEARDELADELGRVAADRMIAEEVGLIEDLLAGGATLEEVAEETLMDLGTIILGPGDMSGIAADAAFREEALEAQKDEFRELADLSDGIFVLRVNDILAPELQDLQTVRDQVSQDWRLAQVQEGLQGFAETLATELSGGKTLADIATEHDLIVTEEDPLTRRDIIQGTPPTFVEQLFETETGEAFYVADGQTVLLGQVGDIADADPLDEELSGALAFTSRDFSMSASDDVQSLFIQAIQENGGVTVNQSLVEQVNRQMFGPNYQ